MNNHQLLTSDPAIFTSAIKSSTMERMQVQALITRLKEQFDEHAEQNQLLQTIQQLQQVVAAQMPVPRSLGTAKVAVVMPSNINASQIEKYAPRPVVAEPVAQVVSQPVKVNGNGAANHENGQHELRFDPMIEIPTLTQQVKPHEKKITEPESLNDRLKQSKTELMEVLKDSPVKDLRKAIGINDRFLFINDLFRGDEAMYERSIKTINGFNIYPEAEYWINRELKVKLGWNPENHAVTQFDQLVKRRFS